jgi:hypothetical protein
MKEHDEKDDPRREGTDPLQEAIDASLRRLFTAPSDLELAPAPAAEPAGSLLDWWPLAGVAAACLALLLYWVRQADEPGPLPRVAAESEEPSGLVPAPWVENVDLEAVYREAELLGSTVSRDPGAALCGFEESAADDGLLATLERRYGQSVALSPLARRQLVGPLESREWPTATIFLAFPRDGQGRLVVLVAESEAHFHCCIQPRDPGRGDLRSFTWMVGKLFLTEITPLSEPQLLQEIQEIR